jgi:hypothetical protein
MSTTIDATWLLLIPLCSVLGFTVWALWNFSSELRAGRRRRVHRIPYIPEVRIYRPTSQIARFRRSHDKEAA